MFMDWYWDCTSLVVRFSAPAWLPDYRVTHCTWCQDHLAALDTTVPPNVPPKIAGLRTGGIRGGDGGGGGGGGGAPSTF